MPTTVTRTPGRVAFVSGAASYALENGIEKAVAAFNDPNRPYISDIAHISAIRYNWMVFVNTGGYFSVNEMDNVIPLTVENF